MSFRYALIGAAGYIAPKHIQAIKDIGGELIAAYDPHDSVGILDKYFSGCEYFSEFERFDRHIDKERRRGVYIDYLVICSPNYLHDSHCRYGLRNGMNVICEKPLTLNAHNAVALMEIEDETKKKVNNILQLRLHPTIIELKERIEKDKTYNVQLTYNTPRGKWYHSSWKGDEKKSGGIATNIGIHFFDMLQWIFGREERSVVKFHNEDNAAGFLKLEGANVDWTLSLKGEVKREMKIDGFYNIDFSQGFTDLHTLSYKNILEGKGFSIEDVLPSIGMVEKIRNTTNK